MGMMRIFSFLAAACLAGCATTAHQFVPLRKDAGTASGQARYEGHGRSLIGDIVLSQSAAGTRMEFVKGAGVPLIRVLSDATHWRFEGLLARGARDIPRSAKLPDHLVIWSQLATRPASTASGKLSHDGESVAYRLTTLR
jgi:hypothetical protein